MDNLRIEGPGPFGEDQADGFVSRPQFNGSVEAGTVSDMTA